MKRTIIILVVGFLLLLGSEAGAQFATSPDSSTVAGWQFTTFTDVDDSLTDGHQIYEKIDSTTAVIDSAVGAERAAVAASVDEAASSVWAGRVSDETGTGLWVYGTSPTFTTDITSPLVIGGTATTSDLSLKTTSGVGETGADMHFLVGNDGATEAMTILNNGKVGLGTDSTSSILHVKANTPGTVGSHPAGQLIIQNPSINTVSNVVITGYNSDGNGNPDQQLWYLGSASGSTTCLTLLNRRNSKLFLGTNSTTRMTIAGGDGNVGIGTLSPPERLSVVGNIATGDSTTGDVDVFHYFSTDASWTTEYLKWDDGNGRFEFSDDLTATSYGGITEANLVDKSASEAITGAWDFGGAAGLEIPAVDDPTTDAEGEIAWDANHDAIEVYMGDEGESALLPVYQCKDAHIYAPDGINDEISIFRVDALLYPFGIEIDQVSITLDSDAEYSIVFEEWSGDPPTAENDISTVTTAADDAYAEEAPDTDAAIDADDEIFLHIPATDVDWIRVQIIFHVNDGN